MKVAVLPEPGPAATTSARATDVGGDEVVEREPERLSERPQMGEPRLVGALLPLGDLLLRHATQLAEASLAEPSRLACVPDQFGHGSRGWTHRRPVSHNFELSL